MLVLPLLGWASAQEPCPPGTPRVVIYHPGSVSPAFKAVEELFTRQTGVCVVDMAGGSVGLARQVTAGREPCDLLASADSEIIERMVKPAGFADYTIRFAAGAMVLAYATGSRQAGTIAAPGKEALAAPDWYAQLARPGVTVAGSHPFLDPSGYRAHMIFQLVQDHYGAPGYYNEMLGHYRIAGAAGGLGQAFDYQFIYEHSARAAMKADATGTYRYVRLPDEVNLGAPGLEPIYGRRGVALPGLQSPGAAETVTLPATRVTWGITLMNGAVNREPALAFLQLLFSPQGAAILEATGPAPISPPVVSRQDYARLPAVLKALVRPL